MKNVVVFEEPKNCAECPCSNDCVNKCKITENEISAKNMERGKPRWCPLIPLPGLMALDDKTMFEHGWNAALFSIGGYDE